MLLAVAVVRFARPPVAVGDWSATAHPRPAALLRGVRTPDPHVGAAPRHYDTTAAPACYSHQLTLILLVV